MMFLSSIPGLFLLMPEQKQPHVDSCEDLAASNHDTLLGGLLNIYLIYVWKNITKHVFFHNILGKILPIDELLIFQRGRSTTNH
jgi:hypothetical protein